MSLIQYKIIIMLLESNKAFINSFLVQFSTINLTKNWHQATSGSSNTCVVRCIACNKLGRSMLFQKQDESRQVKEQQYTGSNIKFSCQLQARL